MKIFEAMVRKEHDQLAFWSDVASGYRGIIAIHDTTLGPALGGTRFWNYGSEAEAITDVLRLARGMPYKAAITGLALGGGKSVIIGDNRTTDREAIFRAHGRAIEALGGRYITAEDVGTSVGTTWSTFEKKPSGLRAYGVGQAIRHRLPPSASIKVSRRVLVSTTAAIPWKVGMWSFRGLDMWGITYANS